MSNSINQITTSSSIPISDQIILVSSDKQEFITSKIVLGVQSNFFSSLFLSSTSNDNKCPMTENNKEIKLFAEVIEGRAKGNYSFEEAKSLMLMGDKYDCWSLVSTGKSNLLWDRLEDEFNQSHIIEIYCLAAKIGDHTLANHAAKSSLRAGLVDQSAWTTEAQNDFKKLDIVSKLRLRNFHLEHIQAIITAVSTESHVHLSDKCIGTREALLGAVLLKIKPNSDLEQLINTEAQILHQKRKSEVCDYCRRRTFETHIQAWKLEKTKIPLPF